MATSKYSRSLHIRAEPVEVEMIDRNAEAMGMSRSRFMCTVASTYHPDQIEADRKAREQLEAAIQELNDVMSQVLYHQRAIGNNLNQLTRRVHSAQRNGQEIDGEELYTKTSMLGVLESQLANLISEVRQRLA